ncbi:MAG TPA: hypothetical protein VF263_13120 [Longimicrobiaceae bacterium]
MAAVLAAEGAARQARAQQTYTTIPVSLNSRVFRAVLPYREPFFLTTTSDVAIVRLNARVRERVKADDSLSTAASCVPTLRGWIRPGPESLGVGKAGDTLYVRVPELRANRRYVFCLDSTGRIEGAALTSFQQAAAGILDETLREFDRELRRDSTKNRHQIDSATVASLKRRLVRELASRTGRDVRVADTLSAFDTLHAALPMDNSAQLTRLIAAQAERASVVTVITTRSDTIVAPESRFLGWAVADPSLSKLMGAETQGKLDSVRVSGVPVGSAMATARALHGSSTPTLRAAVNGVIPLLPGSIPPVRQFLFEDVWSSEQLAVNITTLDANTQRLLELRTLVNAVRSDPVLRGSVGWSRVEADTLYARLGKAVSGVNMIRTPLARMSEKLTEREHGIQEAARSVGSQAQRQVALDGTSILDFQARATSTINADLGVAYVGGIREVVPYFGVNFYPTAINKRVPLTYAGRWEDRFALTLGLTATSVARQGDRENLFSSFGMLAGAGLRIADPIRVAVGGVFMRDVPDDPFDTARPVVWAPFVSASLDADVRSALGKIADKLF